MQTPEYQLLLRANRWKLLRAEPETPDDGASISR
jgi:hypothetical protein